MSKREAQSLEIVPATKGQIFTGENLHLDENLSNEGMANAIRADIAFVERNSRLVAFAALRIGLRLLWVRDTGKHGDIGKFIASHLQGIGRTSLSKYMNVAEAFATESKLLNKRTQKLTDGSAVDSIVSEQLDLFADPKAQLEGALKKVTKWVGDRGLSQIYRDIADSAEEDEAPSRNRTLPPAGGGANRKATRSKRELEEEDAKEALEALQQFIGSKLYAALDEGDLATFMKVTRKAADDAELLIRERAGRTLKPRR